MISKCEGLICNGLRVWRSWCVRRSQSGTTTYIWFDRTVSPTRVSYHKSLPTKDLLLANYQDAEEGSEA